MGKFTKSGGKHLWHASRNTNSEQRHLARWTEINSKGETVHVFNYVKTPMGGCKHQSSMDNGEEASCMYCHQIVKKCNGEDCNRVVTSHYAKRNWKSGYCPNCVDDYVV